MKTEKIIIGFLIVTIFFVSAAVSVAAGSSCVRGDADGDGQVTVDDATAIQRKLAQLPADGFNEKAADIDSDGLDITDATRIRRFLAGFGNPYHIGETVGDNTQPTFDEYELPVIK